MTNKSLAGIVWALLLALVWLVWSDTSRLDRELSAAREDVANLQRSTEWRSASVAHAFLKLQSASDGLLVVAYALGRDADNDPGAQQLQERIDRVRQELHGILLSIRDYRSEEVLNSDVLISK